MFNSPRDSISPQLQRLIEVLSKVQGFGPKSARRAVLQLLKRRDNLLAPLIGALQVAYDEVKTCHVCGNLDTRDPCSVCTDTTRDKSQLCVIADVGDLWAFERSGGYRGQYHILGGLLNALDGISPEDLKIPELMDRINEGHIKEVILALSATIDGQSTTLYLAEALENRGLKVTRLSHGLPIGGELDHIDDGTLMAALKSRREL